LERRLQETCRKRRKSKAVGREEHMLPSIPWNYISAGNVPQQVRRIWKLNFELFTRTEGAGASK